MPIEVSWGNPEQSIIVSRFIEEWTLEDGHTMIDDMYSMTSTVNHTVHVVIDFTHSLSSPAKLLTAGSHIEKRSSPNTGISIVVKANGFLRAMTQLITKMFVSGSKLHFVNTLDEAYQIVAQHEQSRVKS